MYEFCECSGIVLCMNCIEFMNECSIRVKCVERTSMYECIRLFVCNVLNVLVFYV